jgi:hypothetical protein
VLRTWKFTTR